MRKKEMIFRGLMIGGSMPAGPEQETLSVWLDAATESKGEEKAVAKEERQTLYRDLSC